MLWQISLLCTLIISCNSSILSFKFVQGINVLLLICRDLFGSRKYLTKIHFLCYKCPKYVPNSLIIVTVSFGIQIRQIYKHRSLRLQYQSLLGPFPQGWCIKTYHLQIEILIQIMIVFCNFMAGHANFRPSTVWKLEIFQIWVIQRFKKRLK